MTQPPLRLTRSTFARTTGNDSTVRLGAAMTCAMCGMESDVVLCSFAFQQVHRRVPLCPEHRAPLTEIDERTRLGFGSHPASTAAANIWPGRVVSPAVAPLRNKLRIANRTRPLPTGPDGATVTVLKDRLR